MSKITLRCAIYTRKSTEEGLEQEFNSLDAQREACAAFITSQVGQGWKELPKLYDDGGISAPFSLKRRGNEAKLIVGDQVTQPTLLDETLIKTKSNALRWMKQLQTGEASTVFEIAKSEALDDGEISRVLPLAFLAPDVVEAILEGRQSLNLTARDLKRLKPLPISWVKQRQVLGFPAKI
jgi:hypothetical protein